MYRKQSWEALRANGRRRFVWGVGVVGWGLINAVLWAITFEFVRSRFTQEPYAFVGVLKILAAALLFFLTAGYLWGVWVWKIMDRRRAGRDRRRAMQSAPLGERRHVERRQRR